MKKFVIYLLILFPITMIAEDQLLTKWQFVKSESFEMPVSGWQEVEVPHDWAIYGPFEKKNDLQVVQVVQNGETEATEKTGRSGGLPWMGYAWYKTTIDIPATPREHYSLLFDGAMSNAVIYIDGKEVGGWPYGYNSFHFNVTDYLTPGTHELLVSLHNKPSSSRWYPGAGLYRNVHLIASDKVHVPVWGIHILTPHITTEEATVRIFTTVEGAGNEPVRIRTRIYNKKGEIVSEATTESALSHSGEIKQELNVQHPALWSPEHPNLYTAEISVNGGKPYKQTFGIRKIEYDPRRGFLLNDSIRKFKGVCLHHDLGALGTAVHKGAIRHQIRLLKDMGCDAIRTSHNMPAPELVELCDEMGMMMMVESFDIWDLQKTKNDYHVLFNEWAERDLENMVRHYRNNASVVMWSIGNEVWNQTKEDGWMTVKWLQAICHRLDVTRPVTCGSDQLWCILDNGFSAALDIPGFNYRTHRYEEAHQKLPGKLILGSETASTVSTRGNYTFPVRIQPDALYPNQQCSGYDVEYCSWSGLPDQDFALQDDYDWTIGQFVWTGIDYLGEPSPYDTDAWPSHSSYFGIIDLAYLPKDRFYLYRSQWNTESPTAHVLPHWTWPGREGEITPVFAYTSYPEAELIINGKSYGRKRFATREEAASAETVPLATFELKSWGSPARPELLPRYRLMWLNAIYQPGEMKVLFYANIGDKEPVCVQSRKTAGRASKLQIEQANNPQDAALEGLYYFTVSATDRSGNLCPNAQNEVLLTIKGDAEIVGVANGDATSLADLKGNCIPLFNGMATVIVSSNNGQFELTAQAKGVSKARLLFAPKK